MATLAGAQEAQNSPSQSTTSLKCNAVTKSSSEPQQISTSKLKPLGLIPKYNSCPNLTVVKRRKKRIGANVKWDLKPPPSAGYSFNTAPIADSPPPTMASGSKKIEDNSSDVRVLGNERTWNMKLSKKVDELPWDKVGYLEKKWREFNIGWRKKVKRNVKKLGVRMVNNFGKKVKRKIIHALDGDAECKGFQRRLRRYGVPMQRYINKLPEAEYFEPDPIKVFEDTENKVEMTGNPPHSQAAPSSNLEPEAHNYPNDSDNVAGEYESRILEAKNMFPKPIPRHHLEVLPKQFDPIICNLIGQALVDQLLSMKVKIRISTLRQQGKRYMDYNVLSWINFAKAQVRVGEMMVMRLLDCKPKEIWEIVEGVRKVGIRIHCSEKSIEEAIWKLKKKEEKKKSTKMNTSEKVDGKGKTPVGKQNPQFVVPVGTSASVLLNSGTIEEFLRLKKRIEKKRIPQTRREQEWHEKALDHLRNMEKDTATMLGCEVDKVPEKLAMLEKQAAINSGELEEDINENETNKIGAENSESETSTGR